MQKILQKSKLLKTLNWLIMLNSAKLRFSLTKNYE